MLLAFAGFGWLAWRKLAIVIALQPEARLDQPWQRLRSVLVNGLLQQRMVRREWRPGLMHAVLFLGFMSLLLRKLQLIAIGYRESASFPNAFGGPFAAFKDAIELAVVAAVLYAFYRRFVLRPARLVPNREALLVLSLILAIMVTDFAFDGFRFALLAERFPAIAHERAFAFVGSALARGVLRAEPGGAADGLRARLLDADGRRVLLPRAAAGRRALPHRHGAADLVLPARSTGPPRADGRRREADGGDRRGRHEGAACAARAT